MRRQLLVFAVLALGLACGRVLFDTPNAYPCDFSKGPGVRDQACVAGDVCGVSNVCQRYIYEGPRFEGPPSLPTFDRTADGGVPVVHPLLLASPVRSVARGGISIGGVVVGEDVALTDTATWAMRNRHVVDSLGTMAVDAGLETQAFLGGGALAVLNQDRSVSLVHANGQPTDVIATLARHIRRIDSALYVVGMDGSLEHVVPAALGPPVIDSLGLGVNVLDVVQVSRRSQSVKVALTSNGLQLLNAAADAGPTSVNFTVPDGSTLEVDTTDTVLTVTMPDSPALPSQRHDVLSTWQISDQLQLSQAWPDCTPCGHQFVEAVSPLPAAQGLGVEVLCQSSGKSATRTVVRVTASTATDPSQSCETTPMEPKVPGFVGGSSLVFAKLPGGGVLAGGSNGEVITGPSLSAALPNYLDRVPSDVGTVNVAGTPVMLAVTDDYFAVQELPGATANGFRRIDVVADLGGGAGVTALRTIGGVQGWGVLSNGVVTKVAPPAVQPDGGLGVGGMQFGPRLLTSNDQPITRSGGGEAFLGPDGGTLALYIAADDGVYALTGPAATLSDVASGNGSLGPQLNPEPSTPIRSFALERTPLGTDGVNRARGYLVTSRNVYAWQLAGTPPRWSATPLVLSGGEPVEVWFDRPRGAIARVGYRDGLIFTLPGGYQLTEAIPGDGGVAPQVFDYENLGGWPVAYASNGLFVAEYELVDGGLLNTFPDGGINRPMTWRAVPVPLADGGQLGPGQPGKLFVFADPRADGGTPNTFHLNLFLEHQVLEVGTMVRSQ